jgi:hypothetical protein
VASEEFVKHCLCCYFLGFIAIAIYCYSVHCYLVVQMWTRYPLDIAQAFSFIAFNLLPAIIFLSPLVFCCYCLPLIFGWLVLPSAADKKWWYFLLLGSICLISSQGENLRWPLTPAARWISQIAFAKHLQAHCWELMVLTSLQPQAFRLKISIDVTLMSKKHYHAQCFLLSGPWAGRESAIGWSCWRL